LARRYVFVEALQFGVLAVAVPALVVLGAPFSGRGRASTSRAGRGARVPAAGRLQALAAARSRHRGPLRSFAFLLAYCAATIAWRVPAAVDGLAQRPLLLLLEVPSLVVFGVLLWLELVPSEPFVPRSAYPLRIALAVIAMWTTWTVGYLLGLSHAVWFPAYHHTKVTALSLSADQELAAGALWLLPAMAYVPVVFASLMIWLKHSEDPDDELRRLLVEERRRSRWEPPARE
jgi:cytochrome c oxidase assembly factor CtaG